MTQGGRQTRSEPSGSASAAPRRARESEAPQGCTAPSPLGRPAPARPGPAGRAWGRGRGPGATTTGTCGQAASGPHTQERKRNQFCLRTSVAQQYHQLKWTESQPTKHAFPRCGRGTLWRRGGGCRGAGPPAHRPLVARPQGYLDPHQGSQSLGTFLSSRSGPVSKTSQRISAKFSRSWRRNTTSRYSQCPGKQHPRPL